MLRTPPVLFVLLSVLGGSAVVATPQRGANLYEVTIAVSNEAPNKGTCQTPVWVGIHDGSFDASASLGEDRITTEFDDQNRLIDDFAYSRGGSIDEVVGSGPICPQDRVETKVIVNAATELYLSYLSGVIPSNGAFISNAEPDAHLLFNDDGEFDLEAFSVAGSEALVGDTERSSDEFGNTGFVDDMESESGVADKRSLRVPQEGLRRGQILADKRFKNADFSKPGYTLISVDANARTVVNRVTAKMRGNHVNPAVDTEARGMVTLRFLSNGDLAYRVILSAIDNVLLAKMNVVDSPQEDDLPQEDGEEFFALELFDGSELERSGHGVMKVQGEISKRGFRNGEFERLWQNALAGKVHVTVVTKGHPEGEIRGAFR